MEAQLGRYGLRTKDDWACKVLVRVISKKGVLLGYVVYRDEDMWKLLGGAKEPEDANPLATLDRRMPYKTGLRGIEYRYVGKQWLHRHYWLLFVGTVQESALKQVRGSGDGLAQFFPAAEFRGLIRNKKFLLKHYAALLKFELLRPLEGDRTACAS